jgi:hypothetical protein
MIMIQLLSIVFVCGVIHRVRGLFQEVQYGVPPPANTNQIYAYSISFGGCGDNYPIISSSGYLANACICGTNSTGYGECQYANATMTSPTSLVINTYVWQGATSCTGPPTTIQAPQPESTVCTSTTYSYTTICPSTGQEIFEHLVPGYYKQWKLLAVDKASAASLDPLGAGQVVAQYPTDPDCAADQSFSTFTFLAASNCITNPTPCNTSIAVLDEQSAVLTQFTNNSCQLVGK